MSRVVQIKNSKVMVIFNFFTQRVGALIFTLIFFLNSFYVHMCLCIYMCLGIHMYIYIYEDVSYTLAYVLMSNTKKVVLFQSKVHSLKIILISFICQ